MNMELIKRALPVESGKGARSRLRARPDVCSIVVDCVLQKEPYTQIAKRLGVGIHVLEHFRKSFITEEVKKIVLVEEQKRSDKALDDAVNDAQSDLELGIHDILKEQKSLYRSIKQRIDNGERDLDDSLSPLMQLLRDQTKSYEALLKVFANLKDKTTVVLSLNEHPEVAKLMDVLWVLFKTHPEAFADFQALIAQKKIALDVDP